MEGVRQGSGRAGLFLSEVILPSTWTLVPGRHTWRQRQKDQESIISVTTATGGSAVWNGHEAPNGTASQAELFCILLHTLVSAPAPRRRQLATTGSTGLHQPPVWVT